MGCTREPKVNGGNTVAAVGMFAAVKLLHCRPQVHLTHQSLLAMRYGLTSCCTRISLSPSFNAEAEVSSIMAMPLQMIRRGRVRHASHSRGRVRHTSQHGLTHGKCRTAAGCVVSVVYIGDAPDKSDQIKSSRGRVRRTSDHGTMQQSRTAAGFVTEAAAVCT